MKFHRLVSRYTWKDIREDLLLLYPDEEKSIAGYEKAFAELKNTAPTSSEYTIHIETVYIDSDTADSSYENVYALLEDDATHYALDFVAWSEVLASQIAEDVFDKYPELEAICHILFEITFYGYSSAEIEAKSAEFNATVAELESKRSSP